MGAGFFITLEGGEGGGKSTQASLLAEHLRETGRTVVLTREPGGTPEGEAIRELLLTGGQDRWTPIAETLLFFAARAMHLDRKIRPALEQGAIVICDRFTDSTRAYQGAAEGVKASQIDALAEMVVSETVPDLTFYLDLDPEEGLRRAGKLGPADRFEARDLDFHKKLRAAFQEIADSDRERIVTVDAGQPIDQLADFIVRRAEARLSKKSSNN